MNFKGTAENGKVQGVGVIKGGDYDRLDIDGVCTVDGDLKAETLKVNGVCTCNGSIDAEKFECDGVLTINGNLRAGTIDIDGVVTINGEKVEADHIDCEGVMSVNGEISADVIDADGKLNAREIVGDSITIKSYWKRGAFAQLMIKAGEKMNKKFSEVDLIEGTTVDLQGVRAKSVNGQNVNIRKNCNIDIVEASGVLTIDPRAVVGKVANA